MIVYREQDYDHRSREKALALARFLWWATHDGQHDNARLNYAPLSALATRKAEAILLGMTFRGKRLLAPEAASQAIQPARRGN
jgi:phosphate transport system substrate-binding protein